MKSLLGLLLALKSKEITYIPLAFYILVNAIAELASFGAVIPLLISFFDIKKVKMFVAEFFPSIQNVSDNNFFNVAVVVLVVLVIGAILLRYKTADLILSYCQKIEKEITVRLFRSLITRDYPHLSARNTSDVRSRIIVTPGEVTYQCILPAIQAFSQLLILTSLVCVAAALAPFLVLSVLLTLFVCYAAYDFLSRANLEKYGLSKDRALLRRAEIVNQAFSSIKEVKILSLEAWYGRKLSDTSTELHRAARKGRQISSLLKYLLEIVAVLGVFLIVLSAQNVSADPTKNLIVIGAFGYSLVRLLPALQGTLSTLSSLRFLDPTLRSVLQDIQVVKNFFCSAPRYLVRQQQRIYVRSLSFKHTNSTRECLNNINLHIEGAIIVGITGKSGEGKSTLLDILLGLQPVGKGEIVINGLALGDSESREYNLGIAFVPQYPVLLTGSVAENIMLETPWEQNSERRLEECAKTVELHGFVTEYLGGYHAEVGDQGNKLSGGFKQRLAIARALYRNPSTLFLDEATSAIDPETESKILANLRRDFPKLMIIAVTHSEFFLRQCDRVYELVNGELKERK